MIVIDFDSVSAYLVDAWGDTICPCHKNTTKNNKIMKQS